VSAWPNVSVHPHRFGGGNSASVAQKSDTRILVESLTAEKPMNTGEINGRHEETRTPDLYRVKGATKVFTTTYMVPGDCQVPQGRVRRSNRGLFLWGRIDSQLKSVVSVFRNPPCLRCLPLQRNLTLTRRPTFAIA